MLQYHRKLLSGVDQGSGAATESTKVAIHAFATSPYIYVYDIDATSGFTGGPRSPAGANIIAGSHFGGLAMRGDYVAQTGIDNATNSAVWKDDGSSVTLLSGATGLQSLPSVNGFGGGCIFLEAGGDPYAYLLVHTGNASGIVCYARSGDTFTSVGTVGGTFTAAATGVHGSGDTLFVSAGADINEHDGDGTFTNRSTTFASAPTNPSPAISNVSTGGKRYMALAGTSTVTFYDVTNPASPSLMSTSGVFSGNTCRGVSFNPANPEQAVAVADGSPYAQIIELVSTTWTAVSSPFNTAPTAACRACDWSALGGMIVLAQEASPYILAYSMSGTSATKFTDPATLIGGIPGRESVSFN